MYIPPKIENPIIGEDLISHAMVRSPNGGNYALSSYLADGDIAVVLPLKIDCPTYLYTRS